VDGVIEIREKIAGWLGEAISQAQAAGKLPQTAVPDITVERPQDSGHGDYATSLPLKLARVCGKSPLQIAGILAEFLKTTPELDAIEVAPPGFINFSLSRSWLSAQVGHILAAGDRFGNINLGRGRKVQVEFVSANPTGPLHVGHGRGAVLGSTLAGVLSSAGYNVQKEYYINDAGSQMNAFYRTLWARYQQELGHEAEMPEGGYFGRYMVDLAKEVVAEEGDRFIKLAEGEGLAELGKLGIDKMLTVIKHDLEMLGVRFECWFSEKSLFAGGQFQLVLDALKRQGHLAEKEGAVWFTSTALGEDKDNVVIRSDGTPTYFATDIAYHYNKFLERGFDEVIDIWGADHQGHVTRMKAVVGALGIDPERLQVIISQLVTLRRGGESVKFSKRSGDIITLHDVMEEVGMDACRFFFLCRSADSQMDFDLELAKKESSENPVYYVQYAHARISSILRLAQDEGIDFREGDVNLLMEEAELSLIRQMLRLPEVIEMAASHREPQYLPYYAQELATAFHSFYKQCRVVVKENAAQTQARLKLVAATRVVLARTLHLMGMHAPEKM
jgi:arginyl-tRNA synthetase